MTTQYKIADQAKVDAYIEARAKVFFLPDAQDMLRQTYREIFNNLNEPMPQHEWPHEIALKAFIQLGLIEPI